MTTRLLHLGSIDDENYSQRLAGLTAGMDVSWKQRLTAPDTITEIELQCKSAHVDGVVCSNESFLERLLYAQPDFTPPNGKKKLSLDDYQGSLLFTPRDKLPVVVINPLANLITVPYATPAAKRFIRKLTSRGKWFRQTAFTWDIARPETVEQVFDRFARRATIIGVDIETIRDDPLRRISCIGFCAYYSDTHTTECIVIPFTDMYWHAWVQKFCDSAAPKVFQNGMYDNLYLLRWGCPVRNWLHDTQHLFHSMYSEYPKRLDFITSYSLRVTRYWKDDGKTGNLEDFYRYNARDCWATVNSYLSLLSEAEPYAFTNYVQEFPLVFPALTCEIEGLKVDMERLATVKAEMDQSVLMDDAKFQHMLAAPGFNSNSPKQRLALFKVLGLGHLTSTDKANMLKAKASSSFNERILTEMSDMNEEKKLLSTYLVPEKFWNGRLHYKINPAGTDTGRLASMASSYWCGLQIQNMPRGKEVKQCLLSDNGWYLAEIDKAQSEARCVGYLAGETKLIAVVEGPHDYHAWNAQAFFGIPYETIYSDELKSTINKTVRDLSKRTNHGANYNMGEGVMLDTMGPKYVSQAKVILRLAGSLRQVCKFLLERYAQTYPRVKGTLYESIIREIKLTGRLLSPTGRTRIFFGKPWTNKRDLNAAVAHKPQSLSADLINVEWYNFWRSQMYGSFYKFKNHDFTLAPTVCNYDLRGKARLKANIHDSILFQYKKTMPNVPKEVQEFVMDSRIEVTDPDGIMREMYIPTDISAGKQRWSEIK